MKQAALLVLGCLGFWAATYFLWRLWLGDDAGLVSLVACGLCLVPSLITMWWAHKALKDAPLQLMAAALGGTLARMVVALGGWFVVTTAWAETFTRETWLVLAAFYFWTLFLDIYFLLSQSKASSPGEQNHKPINH